MVNYRYLIAYLGDLGEEMRGVEDRFLFSRLFEDFPHFHHASGIETQRWLVEDQDRRIMDQGLRQADALAVPLRQVAHVLLEHALDFHLLNSDDVMRVLQCVGGFEIAAIVGSYIRCAQLGLTIVVDGFIASAAALAATRICAAVGDWVFFAHASAEPGHRHIMQALNARPLLDLGMRLGEGSGAATAVATMRLAVALHNGMATFAEAGVTEKQG